MTANTTRIPPRWRNYVRPDIPEPLSSDDPWGNEIDRPGAAWLAIIDRPLDESDFRETIDPRTGESRFEPHRPFYCLHNDATSHDDIGGEILIGDQRGDSVIGGGSSNRVPHTSLAGQNIRRNRIGSSKKSLTEEEAKSEGRLVNDDDKANGVVYVQVAE